MFYAYAIFLTLSGILMLVMALAGRNYNKGRQILNFIFGAGFTIYGIYLLFVFKGGHYLIFFYAFAIPIFMVIRFFRDREAAKARPMAANPQQPVGSPGPGTWAAGSEPTNGQPPGYQSGRW